MGVEVSASQLTIKDELSKIGSFEVMINDTEMSIVGSNKKFKNSCLA